METNAPTKIRLLAPRRLLSFVAAFSPMVATLIWAFADEGQHPYGAGAKAVCMLLSGVVLSAWAHFDKKGEWQ